MERYIDAFAEAAARKLSGLIDEITTELAENEAYRNRPERQAACRALVSSFNPTNFAMAIMAIEDITEGGPE